MISQEAMERMAPALDALRNSIERQTSNITRVSSATEIIQSDQGAIVPYVGQQGASQQSEALSLEPTGVEFEKQTFRILSAIRGELLKQTKVLGEILEVNTKSFDFVQQNQLELERRERLADVSEEDDTDTEDEQPEERKGFLTSAREKVKDLGGIGGILKKAGIALLIAQYLPTLVEAVIDEFFDGDFDVSKIDFSAAIDKILSNPALALAIGTAFFGGKFLVLGALAMGLASKLKSWIEEGGLEGIGITGDMLGDNFVGVATAAIAALGFGMFKLAKWAVMKALRKVGTAAVTAVTAAIRTPTPTPGAPGARPGAGPTPRSGGTPDVPEGASGRPASGNTGAAGTGGDDRPAPRRRGAGARAGAPWWIAPGTEGGITPGDGEERAKPLDGKEKAKLDGMTDKKLEKNGIRRVNTPSGPRYQDVSTGKFVSGREALDKVNMNMFTAAATKYPNFAKFATKALKILGPVGAGAIAIYEIADILGDEEMAPKEKGVQLTGAVAGLLGGVGGAAIGASLGTIGIPIPIAGTLLGGLAGGIIGAFGSEYVAEKMVTPWIMGDAVNASPLEGTDEQLAQKAAATEASQAQSRANSSQQDISQKSFQGISAARAAAEEAGLKDYRIVPEVDAEGNDTGLYNVEKGASEAAKNWATSPESAQEGQYLTPEQMKEIGAPPSSSPSGSADSYEIDGVPVNKETFSAYDRYNSGIEQEGDIELLQSAGLSDETMRMAKTSGSRARSMRRANEQMFGKKEVNSDVTRTVMDATEGPPPELEEIEYESFIGVKPARAAAEEAGIKNYRIVPEVDMYGDDTGYYNIDILKGASSNAPNVPLVMKGSSAEISPSASGMDAGLEKLSKIETPAMNTTAASLIAPSVVHGGNNVVNNNKGGDTQITYNITNPASGALSNAIPIPMTAGWTN